MASFKKRTLKGNVRRGESENKDDDEEDTNILGSVTEIKLEQKMRQKKLGAEFSTDGPATGNLSTGSSKADTKSKASNGGLSSLGSQFESRIDTGLSAGKIAHEKIMEGYINERLGLKERSEDGGPNNKKSRTSGGVDDELYKIPEELKVMASAAASSGIDSTAASATAAATSEGANASNADDTSMMTWSLGLAEVALPISFKIKNIEETEKALRKLEEERAANRAKHHGLYGAQTASLSYEAVGAAVATSTSATALPAAFGSTATSAALSSSSSSSLLAAARFWPAHLQMKKNEEREKQKVMETIDVVQGPMPETGVPVITTNEFGMPGPVADSRQRQHGERGQTNSWGQQQGGHGRGAGAGGGSGGRRISNDDYVLNKYKKASLR